jgi:hypothetical protein
VPNHQPSPKISREIPIPVGHAGQTAADLVLVHQIRTIDLGGSGPSRSADGPQALTLPGIRRQVRRALAHHLGLDVLSAADGAGRVTAATTKSNG